MRNISFRVSLTYHHKECPYKLDDVGKEVSKPLEDDYGITTFYGQGYIEEISIAKGQGVDGKDTTFVYIRCYA